MEIIGYLFLGVNELNESFSEYTHLYEWTRLDLYC